MRPDLGGVEPLAGLRGEHSCDEVTCACREEVRALVLSCQDLLVQGCSVLVLERQVATEHCEENDPTTPDVAERWNVLFASNHFWCGITWRATSCFQKLPIPIRVAEAKIHNLNGLVLVNEKIFRLEVTVHHIHPMDLPNALEDLLKEAASLWLV
jgi:hypothetical protein